MDENKLDQLRGEIDEIDAGILKLLGQRNKIVEKIMAYKEDQKIPSFDPDRESKQLQRAMALAKDLNVRPEQVLQIFSVIIKESREHQKKISGK